MGAPPRRVVVGRIVKPHGTKGELVIEVMSDAPGRFARGSKLEAGDLEGARKTLTIHSTRDDRGRLLVRFAQVPDRDAADAVRGLLLSIPSGDAAPLPDGAYYDWQLEGLSVEDEDGHPLGTLARVEQGTGQDRWVVKTDDGEVQVPAVEEFVRRVDLEGGKIVLHLIPGLFDE